jgi:hypothetical protein
MRWVAVLVVSLIGVALGITGLLLLRDDGPEDLLPDLEQGAPMKLEIVEDGDSYRLVFISGVANAGRGPVLIEGSRPSGETEGMSAVQLVRRSDGSERMRALDTELRYVEGEDGGEGRWELFGLAAVELRGVTDRDFVRTGEAGGLCLGDGADLDPGITANGEPERPIWTAGCGRGEPGLFALQAGLSPGYAVREDPGAGNWAVEVTDVPAGRYLLVSTANPQHALEESDYANNVSSVLLQLRRAGAIPSVRVLARCPGSESCSATQR